MLSRLELVPKKVSLKQTLAFSESTLDYGDDNSKESTDEPHLDYGTRRRNSSQEAAQAQETTFE